MLRNTMQYQHLYNATILLQHESQQAQEEAEQLQQKRQAHDFDVAGTTFDTRSMISLVLHGMILHTAQVVSSCSLTS